MIECLEKRLLLSIGLSASQVEAIVDQAAAVSIPQQAIAVVDQQGNVLAIYAQQPSGIQLISPQTLQKDGGLPSPVDSPLPDPASGTPDRAADYAIEQAVAKARTAAFFETQDDAFSTRTARFIIQNNFPYPINDTAGGPLYGVEFSSLYDSDYLPPGEGSGLSGMPGGIPLFLFGQPVGGIGVAGSGEEVAPMAALVPQGPAATGGYPSFAYLSDSDGAFYTGTEEYSYDEAVALAGAEAFSGPSDIYANNIFLSGLRLPFAAEGPAIGPANIPGLRDSASESGGPRAYQFFDPLDKTTANPTGSPNPNLPIGVFGGDVGTIYSKIMGDPLGGGLTAQDVTQIINQAAATALTLRGAIREPIGESAAMIISVVNTAGTVLGTFIMSGAPMFSLDVAVQKARTAAFFSDDSIAISTRALGFISQADFPPGIGGTGSIPGPLYTLQDLLSEPQNLGTTLPNGKPNPLGNGITIFPGGIPLYIDGKLVGAIGVSGDGVDQDDETAYYGATGFSAPPAIQSDFVDSSVIAEYLKLKIDSMQSMGFNLSNNSNPLMTNLETIDFRLQLGLDGVRLPYVKFPQNPQI
jgi:uncharacterized protein GlcG (DUF336 family)